MTLAQQNVADARDRLNKLLRDGWQVTREMERANEALASLRAGTVRGQNVIVLDEPEAPQSTPDRARP